MPVTQPAEPVPVTQPIDMVPAKPVPNAQLATDVFLPDAQLATVASPPDAQLAADASRLDTQLAAVSLLIDAQPDCNAPVWSASEGFMPIDLLISISGSKLPDLGCGVHVLFSDLGGTPPSKLKDSCLKSAKKSADLVGKFFRAFPHPLGLSSQGENGASGGHSLRGRELSGMVITWFTCWWHCCVQHQRV